MNRLAKQAEALQYVVQRHQGSLPRGMKQVFDDVDFAVNTDKNDILRTMKNFKIVFLLAVLLSLLHSTADAQILIGGLYYNLSENSATVVKAPDDPYSDFYKGKVITIPKSIEFDYNTYRVTGIGDEAFKDCGELTSISIPPTVTRIGERAFAFCNPHEVHIEDLAAWCATSIASTPFDYGASLILKGEEVSDLVIPQGVASIADNAFLGCPNIKTVTIPSSVTHIGNSAFGVCENLSEVNIPNSVTTIGEGAFNRCKSLTYIHIPYSVTTIGESAFGVSGITSASLSNTVIGNRMFYFCPLENISMVKGVTTIPEYAFCGCKFPSVVLPEGVTTIGNGTFSDCKNLSMIFLPSSITSIDDFAFRGTNYLRRFYCMSDLPPSVSEWTFYECDLMYTTLVVPVQSVGNYASVEPWNKFYTVVGYGDANSDGKVDIVDVTSVISYILGQTPDGINEAAADVNVDGVVDIVDVTSIIDMILNQ